jgi:hypothetical protein
VLCTAVRNIVAGLPCAVADTAPEMICAKLGRSCEVCISKYRSRQGCSEGRRAGTARRGLGQPEEGCTIVQAACPLFLTGEARDHSQSSPRGIWVNIVELGQVSLQVFSFLHSTSFICTLYSVIIIWGMDKGSVSGGSSVETYSQRSSVLRFQ